MPEQMEPRYDHLKSEEKIYRLWEESGYFNPDKLPKSYELNSKSYSIMMPPPNANGSLHIGHAVGITIEDILIRYWRMRGKKTLWLPGADHAGFETQVVFDKKLEKEGRSRHEMSREELWKEIWEFTQKNKKVMESQLRKLGASCDWSREKFTLDPDIIKTVYETFEGLYKDGLAYRDLKVVNWCPKHKTALSDLEVKYVEREDPLYYIKYGPLTLATVRPETKFGDTALAVNPKDKRYQKYVGKEIEAKGILGTLKFKVIADDAIDPKFGTGVVKITPAHDPLDFEIWQRHKGEIPGPKVVIDESGRLTGLTGPFAGLKVSEAREKVAEKMKEIGILEKVDPHYKHQIATCYKCGNTLEPLPKPQWFIRMTAKPATSDKRQATGKSLRDLGIDAVKSRKIKIYPKRTERVYMHWLKNIRDWNISRQIVWGIRIPAWFCLSCAEPKINPQIKSHWFLIRHGETDWNKEGRFMGQENVPLNQKGIEQAEQTAQRLKDRGIDLIISSDLLRAEQTARILAQKTGAEIVIDKNLREIHAGKSQGLTYDEIAKQHNLSNWDDRLHQDFRFLNGENWDELEKRVWVTFQHHITHHNHKNIAIVAHGGVIRIFQKNLRNVPLKKSNLLDNAGITEFSLASPCKKCGGDFYEQDPDVFDTWFSSGQWPFATLLADKKGDTRQATRDRRKKSDFEEFYPTDVLETGYDILFFWVARMVMLGLYRTGKVPFKNVYLHGLVRDKDRQKMSKSKGNVVDPLGVAEMYGSDALRMALVVGNTPGNDIVISEDKIRGYRNFATKIWNASRFVLMNRPSKMPKTAKLSAEDKKNIAGAKKMKATVAKHIEKLEFHLAAEKAYHYFWHTFADKIIEKYKPRLKASAMFLEEALGPREIGGAAISRGNGNQRKKILADQIAAHQTLETILRECLIMLHPFMPFITEEIYQKLVPSIASVPLQSKSTEDGAKGGEPGKLLLVEKW